MQADLMERYVNFVGRLREGGKFDRTEFNGLMVDLTEAVSSQEFIPKPLVVILVNMPMDLEASEWVAEDERSERERALSDYLSWFDDIFNTVE